MPSPRAMRSAALALAFLALTAQLGGLLHLTLVQHATCPEHGELIHADKGAGSYTLSLSMPAGNAEQPTVKSATEVEHGHEHCSVVLTRREETTAPSGSGGQLPSLPRLHVFTARHEAPPSPAIAILHLAPKNSPTTLL